ncbi:MAG: N-acetyltransferase [Corynebacterium sp.]|nr:N-acetyltransferase [Corynebacterium sp.]
MPISIRCLTPSEFALNVDALLDVYITAMSYDPRVRASRRRSWLSDITKPGFVAFIAEDSGKVAGVAYGFLGNRESWWDRQLRLALRKRQFATNHIEPLLASYFEVAEVHVLPDFQGQGIGRFLLEKLLSNTPAQWALLSTPEVKNEANLAFGLYRSLGFRDLVRHYYYPSDERPFAILAKPLCPSAAVRM